MWGYGDDSIYKNWPSTDEDAEKKYALKFD